MTQPYNSEQPPVEYIRPAAPPVDPLLEARNATLRNRVMQGMNFEFSQQNAQAQLAQMIAGPPRPISTSDLPTILAALGIILDG